MNKFNKKHFIAVAAAMAMLVVLYSLRTKPDRTISEQTSKPISVQFELKSYIDQKKSSLEAVVLQNLKNAETRLEQEGSSVLYEEICNIWLKNGEGLIAAHYAHQLAEKDNAILNWTNAGKLFYDANQSMNESEIKRFSLKNAVECYEKALKIEPENTDVLADLALCYVENTEDPMKGVKILLDIVSKTPEHLKANMNLGILSVRSGQYDKAIGRFEKVLSVQKNNKEALIKLVEVMELTGNFTKSKEYKKIYEELTNS